MENEVFTFQDYYASFEADMQGAAISKEAKAAHKMFKQIKARKGPLKIGLDESEASMVG